MLLDEGLLSCEDFQQHGPCFVVDVGSSACPVGNPRCSLPFSHFLHPIPGSSLSVRAGRQGPRSILFSFLKMYLSSLVKREESSGSKNCLDAKPQVNRDSGGAGSVLGSQIRQGIL